MSLVSYEENRPIFVNSLLKNVAHISKKQATKNILEWEKEDPFFMYFNWLELSLTQKLFGTLVTGRNLPQEFYENDICQNFSISECKLKTQTKELLKYLWDKKIIKTSGRQYVNLATMPIYTDAFMGALGVMGKYPVIINFYNEETENNALRALGRKFTNNMHWLHNADDIRQEFLSKKVLTFNKAVIPQNPIGKLEGKSEFDIKATLNFFARAAFSELTADIVLAAYGNVPGIGTDEHIERTGSIMGCLLENYRGVIEVWYAIKKREFSEKVQSELKNAFQFEDRLEHFLNNCDEVYTRWTGGIDWIARADQSKSK